MIGDNVNREVHNFATENVFRVTRKKYILNYALKRRNFKQTYLVTYVLIRISANIKYPQEIKNIFIKWHVKWYEE